jgi:hypothetical protein
LAVILGLLAVILSAAKDLRSCFLDSEAYDELQRCFAPLSMTAFIPTPDFCLLTPESRILNPESSS